jgi:hypothetical protein
VAAESDSAGCLGLQPQAIERRTIRMRHSCLYVRCKYLCVPTN